MSNATVVNKKDNILTITMNRPIALNALNLEMTEALNEAIYDAEQDKEVRCVVIRGSNHFMAGGDLKWFAKKLNEVPEKKRIEFERLIEKVHRMVISIRRMPKPVVASVNGATAGFGFSLAMACDLIIASDSAVFTLAYVNVGVSPDGGSTFSLPRIVGAKKAAEIAFLGDVLDAATAKELGLVNWVVRTEDLEIETVKLATRLANGPTAVIGRTKSLLQQSLNTTLESQLHAEAMNFSVSASEPNFVEGVSAFIGKRKPKFKRN